MNWATLALIAPVAGLVLGDAESALWIAGFTVAYLALWWALDR